MKTISISSNKQNHQTYLLAGLGSGVDVSTICMNVQSNEDDLKPTKNISRNVRTCQMRPRAQNSPIGLEVETLKCPE